MNNNACFLIGVAPGDEQLQEDIDKVTKVIDDMIQTLRANKFYNQN